MQPINLLTAAAPTEWIGFSSPSASARAVSPMVAVALTNWHLPIATAAQVSLSDKQLAVAFSPPLR
jgi:hypothetical protein